MGHDQRTIIKFLHNEKANAHDIIHRLQVQFAQDAYTIRTIQFWIGEVIRGHQDILDENRMGQSPLGDLNMKILATLDKSLFKSAQSISETLRVGLAIVLWHLHDSIEFISFHLY
jgi:hypothetical protein